MKKTSKFLKVSRKLTVIFICMIIAVTVAVGIISYINYRSAGLRTLSETLLAISNSAAAMIDPFQYREIMETKVPNEYHDWLSKQFTNIVNEHDMLFLHAGVIDRHAGFTGFVEAQIPGFNTGLGETTPATRFSEAVHRVMARGRSISIGPISAREYGLDMPGETILVAYSAVYDEHGNIIAIVRAIATDESITASSWGFTLRSIIAIFIVVLLLTIIPISFTKRYIRVPLALLTEATDAAVKGDYSSDLSSRLSSDAKYFSNDELGILSKNFSNMQNLIRDKSKAEISAYQSELAKGHAQALTDAMLESATYASKIQKNLLPTEETMESAFSDFSLIWKPRDIVGGDIYWIKKFDKGTVFCAADCTGHGTPGAFLTLLVISKLDSIVNYKNCDDTAEILFRLDKGLAAALQVESEFDLMNIKDGCDIIAIFIANDGSVTFSAGNANFFICDGKEVIRKRGQRIFIGEGELKSKNDVQTDRIPANPDNKFYLSSDGLYDQPGGKYARTYGLNEFFEIILASHNESLDVILDKVWVAFEKYRGYESRTDDFSLIAFTPYIGDR